MLQTTLLYAGSALAAFWGVMHIVKTGPAVAGFEPLSCDNRRILTMEWILEGVTLCFIAVLVTVVTWFAGARDPVAILVYRGSALLLLVMAAVSLFTGFRTSQLPYKLCPPIFATCALLFLLGSTGNAY